MPSSLRLRRLDALSALLEHFSTATRGERLGAALTALLEASPAMAAAAFARDVPLPPLKARALAELEGTANPDVLHAITALAERAMISGRPVALFGVERGDGTMPHLDALIARGARAALAVPLLAQRATEGAFVLLFGSVVELDAEARSFVDSVARITALALNRDRGLESERQFREELSESGRMATLGLYTTSVAHELRGPAGALVLQHEELRSVAQRLGALAEQAGPSLGGTVAELGEIVADMGVAVDRMRQMVSQLTTAGRRETRPTRVSIAEIVRESLAIARPHLDGRGVVLDEELDPACFAVARRDNLGQVVLNLVFNAADAALVSSPPRVWVKVQGGRDHVFLVVEDNGPGIAPDAVSDIFKPFYTTKPRGKGTGLGLKIVQDDVTAHGGHIEVDARAGGGAVFRVALPRADAGSQRPLSSPNPGLASGVAKKTCKVFLVEDDPVFARTIRRALRPHVVRVATSASEAEIALVDPTYAPDLVVCDVFLPGANGNVLHARLCERRPDLAGRFVFVTGGALGKAEADYLRGSGCLTLFKPLDVRSLFDLLEHREPPIERAVRTLT